MSDGPETLLSVAHGKAIAFAKKQYPDAYSWTVDGGVQTLFNHHCGQLGVKLVVKVAQTCSIHSDIKMHLTICMCGPCEDRPLWREEPTYDCP